MTAHKRRCLTPLLVLQLDGPRRESRRRPRPNIADHLAPARPAAARPEEATAQRALAHAALCLHRPLLVGLERDLDACAVGVLDKLGERRDAPGKKAYSRQKSLKVARNPSAIRR